ncbi:aromatic ring-opening dioxygenase LigA [Georgenia ruanii]|uniref:Aromatic ring-opening dioxygenase LigA n=1 Tax=Georgenia ruanii TaxID=348442 RepID=A0A7J9UU82_9MICO|nr:aromatic ring-opening dioxygenase LigA [Georgenia ruanii]
MIGIIAIVAGILFIVAGAVTWAMITSNLSEQKIVVAQDSPVLAGDGVNGPFSAFAQAQIINTHAEHATGGKTYAQLGDEVTAAQQAGDTAKAEQLQAQRTTVMTASFLRASLFTSVVAYGMAALVVGLGILLILIGWALGNLARVAPASAAAASGTV